MKWIAVALVLSFMPIWRIDATHSGYNLWTLFEEYNKDREHIPYDQAVAECQRAYNSIAGSSGIYLTSV